MYHHKNIRLNSSNYVGKSAYFVTICCFDRNPIFTTSASCTRIIQALRETSTAHSFSIHASCIMPDHVHLLAEGLEVRSDLLNFIKSFKIKTSCEFAGQLAPPLWQKKYFDHVLRPNESIDAVAWYIWLNPIRAGLASEPGGFPFAGSFTTAIPKTHFLAETWTPPHQSKNRPPQKAAAT